ncbi:MAG TPA: hypothetical protein VKV77_06800 [Methylovirgula sp.]|nr:hypothetical protein [Methylovirgula sp.]
MDRIVITIHPAPSDEGLLSVADAMQQVLDSMKLFEDAQSSLGNPRESFAWKLERASANSPFTVVAIAQPLNPTVDISSAVRRVKAEVSEGLRNLITHGSTSPWMTQDSLSAARSLFARNRNGIGETAIDFEDGEVLSIDRTQAAAGIQAIAGINVMVLDQDLPARQSFGEIEGVMVAAGRYRNRAAIQIKNELYGFVWCALSKSLIARFGSEHSMAEIWEGKTVGVQGRLSYANGGKLTFIDALDLREISAAPRVDLSSTLDPNFTAGMDPHEYLEKLHEGQIG